MPGLSQLKMALVITMRCCVYHGAIFHEWRGWKAVASIAIEKTIRDVGAHLSEHSTIPTSHSVDYKLLIEHPGGVCSRIQFLTTRS
jgi:hypothetical protein